MSTLEESLLRMARHGQSVMLTWGEGEAGDLWECSFISGGVRHTAFDKFPTMAAVKAERAAQGAKEPCQTRS